jgi:hypothetical protein
MRIVENLSAQGHPNILGTHRMTFEITKDSELSRRGDCVIGVKADKGPMDLSREFQETCKRVEARITLILSVLGMIDEIHGSGNPALTFTHPTEMVGRRSNFASDRTIMVKADKAACDIDRRMIEALKSSTSRLTVKMLVEV